MSCPEQQEAGTSGVSTAVRPPVPPAALTPVEPVAAGDPEPSAVRPDMPPELAAFITAYERGVRVVPGSPAWRRATALWEDYYARTSDAPVEQEPARLEEAKRPVRAPAEEAAASGEAAAPGETSAPPPAVVSEAEPSRDQHTDPTAGLPVPEGQVRVAGVPLRPVDATAARAGGDLLAARAHTRLQPDGWSAEQIAADAAAEAAECVQACTAAALPQSAGPVDWAGFGTVIPVLSGHPGGGASTVAATLADALAAEGRRVLLLDTADPLRSGLVDATTAEGPAVGGPHRAVRIRQGRRGAVHTARVEFAPEVPVHSPGMVPPPDRWTPLLDALDGAVEVTVVDIGWDAWTLAASPFSGPGAWLRAGTPAPWPVLALRPTLPAARAAEQLLARITPWCTAGGGITPVASIVVVGAKKVPSVMSAAAGLVLGPLLERAVCVPADPVLAERGLTSAPTPASVQQAMTPLLAAAGLARESSRITRARKPRLRRAAASVTEGNP